ncbi:hypothetical protein C8R44DRAFT_782672 [Mycena epipterygia]|nr:hypothetical protein C8R44DRAFT_782672 [Mycena epipterygia]
MKKPKGRGGSRTKSSNRKQNQALEPSKILDVPPELWEIVAKSMSRQSLAQLRSVSRRFCSMLSPLLYANTVEPPLTLIQSSRLIEALSNAETPGWKPHPATLIRQLGITSPGHWNQTPSPASVLALNNIYDLIPLTDRARGAALRVLHWHLECSLDDLGQTLGAPGHFPNLRELVISSIGKNNNFNFVQIRGLEILGIDFRLHDLLIDLDTAGNKICYKFAEAIQMLPSSSPLLHTLRLNLVMPFNDETTFPWDGYDDLIAAINRIHLPNLATLDLSVDLNPDDFGEEIPPDFLPSAIFSHFLSAHPNLLDLTLNVPDTKLPEDTTFLPRLRSFKGSVEHSVAICAQPRQLENLSIRFVVHNACLFPRFPTLSLPALPSLKRFHILAVDDEGSPIKHINELSTASFAQLTSSFPNLTHLDIRIIRRMTEYRETLILLTKLQSLRVQEYRIACAMDGVPRRWPVTKMFPASEYIKEFALFLPSLPQLACIEICVFVDCVRSWADLEYQEDILFSPPKKRVDYFFHRNSSR